MDIKKILTNMGFLALFIFGIMAWIVTTQTENNVNFPITNDPLINETYISLQENLEESREDVEKSSGTFGNTTPTQPFGELAITSMISPTRVIKTMIVGFWNIFIKLPMVVLGVSPIVASLVSSILLLFIIIGIWATWKGVIKQ